MFTNTQLPIFGRITPQCPSDLFLVMWLALAQEACGSIISQFQAELFRSWVCFAVMLFPGLCDHGSMCADEVTISWSHWVINMSRGPLAKLWWTCKVKINLVALTNYILGSLLPQCHLGYHDRNMIKNQKTAGWHSCEGLPEH